ncbi:MAG TPA: hypothetical protein VN033_03140 [Vulgatibacter sp.]|nr:hypothetical protein [Vulgatibacter sp.]
MRVPAFALSLALSVPALGQSPEPMGAEQPVLPRTDPTTWSKNGWKQIKWGMGPGDVKAALKLPDLIFEIDLGEAHVYEATYPESIFNQNVKVSLHFVGGTKLNLVVLQPRVGLGFDDRELKPRLERNCEQWGHAVFDALKSQYGEPTECNEVPWPTRSCRFRESSLGLKVFYTLNFVRPCESKVTYADLAPIERREADERQKEAKKL